VERGGEHEGGQQERAGPAPAKRKPRKPAAGDDDGQRGESREEVAAGQTGGDGEGVEDEGAGDGQEGDEVE
jgi:hypothetical protein